MSASKITSVKSVPAEDCLERKAEEKGVLLKAFGKIQQTCSDGYSSLKCFLTGGKTLKLSFERLFYFFHICPLLSQKCKNKAHSHVSVQSI